MAKLNEARRSLERAKESAKKRLQQLDEERREIKASLKSLDAALKALRDTKSATGRKNSNASSTEQLTPATHKRDEPQL